MIALINYEVIKFRFFLINFLTLILSARVNAILFFFGFITKKNEKAVTLADKIKFKKFINENRNLKTSKLINTIKHVEIGPQTLRRLRDKDFSRRLEFRFKMQNQM